MNRCPLSTGMASTQSLASPLVAMADIVNQASLFLVIPDTTSESFLTQLQVATIILSDLTHYDTD